MNGTKEGREKVVEYLRHIEKVDDLDILIALGMAKEGFDWPFCEQALTIGYRGSLTEIVQIAECSIDYDKDSQITQDFYATVQNKFHYAITGQTAAEIIYTKADHTKEYMGLTTWKHSPEGRILKSDVSVAKNYLPEKEIKRLERTVSGYFDYIEDLIERENTFTMQEFAKSVNEFLSFRRYDILPDGNKGKISQKQAKIKAEKEYDVFNKTQQIESDFDKEVKKLLKQDKNTN